MATTVTNNETSSTDAMTNGVDLTATVVSISHKSTGTGGKVHSVKIELASSEQDKPSTNQRYKRDRASSASSKKSGGTQITKTIRGVVGETLLKGLKKGDTVKATGSILESDSWRALVDLLHIEKVKPGTQVNTVTVPGKLVESDGEGGLLKQIELESGGSLYVVTVEQDDGQCYAAMLRGPEGKKVADGRELDEEVVIHGSLYSYRARGKSFLSIEANSIDPVEPSKQ